jgi:hypothetical protein
MSVASIILRLMMMEDEKRQSRRKDNGSDDCFIATAIYGDRYVPQIETLRQYRDNVLMKSVSGRAFVRLYYSGAGREAADFIKENMPSTIPLIRKGLDLLVKEYSRQLDRGE